MRKRSGFLLPRDLESREAKISVSHGTRSWGNRTAQRFCLLLLLCSAALIGCRQEDEKPEPAVQAGPLVEEMVHGEVEVVFSIDPAAIQYERDTLLTITITAPATVRVGLPELTDRLEGFILNGTFEDPAISEGDRVTRRLNARLTPLPGREHRIAPMPILVSDGGAAAPGATWFPTRPIVLDVTPPMDEDPGMEIRDEMDPVWVRPPFREVAGYAVLLLVALAVVFLLGKLAGRLHRQVKLMRMSPHERALKELAILLAKDLIAKHKVKEFYLQLTMIVRRYIERAHKVRAPEQTTEEFLAAVSSDPSSPGGSDAAGPQFSPEVVTRLREFLQAADLVKFAAYDPTQDDIDRATKTARSYIEQDAAEVEE
ncbi:MAG: hypothetical protein QGG69_02870 [Kiritimatiellia bacterium]|jgi:hypothetical protein|nr:hypothetical protein [Kiritimatiellia bacterium]MDP6631839.1 hypothetical protein [Kiritimatiellia bacterium]MDP6809174.1 hypothetical protein [Kiritimatiellia bacterium]